MTLEKYIETTPKCFYIIVEGPNHRKMTVQEIMDNERLWKLYRKHTVGAVDSIDPPDGYDYARIIRIERGWHM